MISSRRLPRFVLLAAPLLFGACASTTAHDPATVVGMSCPAHTVRYCVGRGENAENGLCRCITQADARDTLERL